MGTDSVESCRGLIDAMGLEVFLAAEFGQGSAAWDGTSIKNYDFSSYDRSFDVAVDSEEAVVFKKDLAARIGNSSHFLCIVGKQAHRIAWMAWQIRKAVELKKNLVAAKTDTINNSPTAMQGVGAPWSTTFNFDSIKKGDELTAICRYGRCRR